jgi:ABC-type phosphate/phosphonate transport system ATPase subunit
LCDRAIILTGGKIAYEMKENEINDLLQCRAIYDKHVEERK